MSISRRKFLLATTSSAAGLVLPAYYDKVLSYLANHGEPLLEAPRSAQRIMYVLPQDLELFIGDPYQDPPRMSWRELRTAMDYDPMDLVRDGELEEDQLDDEACCDQVLEYWLPSDSPGGQAYELIDGLDLGPELSGARAVGGFKHSYGGWSTMQRVRAKNQATLSLLQNRLNELDYGIRLAFYEQ